MPTDIKTPSVAISASTTSANAVIPQSSAGLIRAVNGTSAVAYVTAGGASVAATNANIALAPNASAVFRRDPVVDTHVAALLSTGTGVVSFAPVGADYY